MSPIQQMLLGVGAVATKTYVDDVFSTYVYAGNSTARSINNGLDLSGEGGMVWIKSRDNAYDHYIVDTERGALNRIRSNSTGASGAAAETLTAFNNNGFALGADSINLVVNASNKTYASWSFRKSPMFDVVKWDGDGSGSTRQIAHGLKSIPGMIIMKAYTHPSGVGSTDWQIYHRGLNNGVNPEQYALKFSTGAEGDRDWFGDTAPTATHFTIGSGQDRNGTGGKYVAYVFAGGESTAATARSLDFTPNAHLTVGDHADYRPGTGDFTLEAWIKPDAWAAGAGFWHTINGLTISKTSGGNLGICTNATSTLAASHDPELGQWTHVAVCRSGSTIRMFYNGTQVASGSNSVNYGGTGTLTMGHSNYFDGKISNLRMVKGTALYTSSFRPPTEPLTNITNTKLLICNNSDPTAGTVLPTTISNSSAVASTDSPFDDPAGFVFGDSGDQNVIKCGSYVGNDSTTGPEINLGWEPQYVLIKNSSTQATYTNWYIFDSMRGVVTGSNDTYLVADTSADEEDGTYPALRFTPTGFALEGSTGPWLNDNGDTYVYMAIRRSDGYVGKPPELGTSVFAMPIGTGSGEPQFISNFPVDFNFTRTPDSSKSWYTTARLMGTNGLDLDNSDAEYSYADFTFDHNNGVFKGDGGNWPNTWQSWCWKRHAGLDVVTYKGDGVSGRQISHSMNKAVEMIWVKTRDSTENWIVGHKGLDGGSDPWDHEIALNSSDQEANNVNKWNDTAPTSTHFTLGNGDAVNKDGDDYIAMLFASVNDINGNPISKVGSYTGTANTQTITTGFQPRIMFLKNITDDGYYWQMLDTTRGWTSSSNKRIYFNDSRAQDDNFVIGEPLSTGFTITGTNVGWNKNNSTYIYYAHA